MIVRLAVALAAALAGLLVSPSSHAELLGVTYWNGDLFSVDEATGAVRSVGTTGRKLLNSLTSTPDGLLISVSNEDGSLITIDPRTGAVVESVPLDFGSSGVDVRAIEMAPDGTLLAANRWFDSSLFSIDPVTGVGTRIGALAGYGMQTLDFSPDGVLYGWDFDLGLVTVDPSTARVTDVSASIRGDGLDSISFAPDGRLFGALLGSSYGRLDGLEIYEIDPTSGLATLTTTTRIRSGPDLRGIVFVPEPTSLTMLGVGLASMAIALRSRRGPVRGAGALPGSQAAAIAG